MSLSKYYPTSDAFEPEVIVKQLHDGKFVKTTLPKSAVKGFAAEGAMPLEPRTKQTAPAARESTSATPPPPVEPSSPPQIRGAEQVADNTPSPAIIAQEKAEAYQKGRQDGLAKAEEDFGAATRTLLNCCQQLDTIRETLIANSSQELRDFALAIAERILRLSVLEQDQTIIATIEEALQRAVKSDTFTVYVHPDDLAILNRKSPELIAGLSGLNRMLIKQDITVGRGGAKIESENCTIDATVASQFEAIREEVRRRP